MNDSAGLGSGEGGERGVVAEVVRRARLGCGDRDLRFATVFIDQLCGAPAWQAQIRPILEGVARFERRSRDTCGDEFIVPRPVSIADACRRRAKFRDDASVRGHGDTLSSFNPTHVLAQIVLELANACRNHAQV